MYYKNELNFEYPERCDEHMLEVDRKRKIKLDTEYPYLQKAWWFKLMRGVYWVLLNTIVFPLCRFVYGLRIHGKKNLKKHKKALKGGAITISNHVFMWDYLCVLRAIRPHLAYFPAWKDNLEGGFGNAIRLSGGIPIPTESIHAMIKFKKAMEEVLESGKWMHFFPEGSLWFYYPDIRPFKKAVFQYAVKYDKPIVPISFSFRPRKGITKLFFGKKPQVDMHIGEPLLPNCELPHLEAEAALSKAAYHEMQVMNGICPGDPTYNTDQNPLHYQKTM